MQGSQRLDVVLGGTLLVTGLLEVAADRVGFRPIPAVIAVLVGSAAMLLRSTRPVLCLAVFVTVAVVTQIPGIAEALTASVAVGCLLALGNVGRRSSDPISITAVIATIAIFTLGTVFGSRPLDAVVVVLGCGTAWGAGRLMRRDARRNIELIELAAQLTSEREARAREAVGAERARIARELHDAVAHTVSVMTIQTGGVRRRLDTDPERVRERDVLLNVEHLGREAVEELHRAVGLLRSGSQVDGDAPLTPPRLADIDQLVAGVRAAGIPVDVKIEGAARPLPAGLDLVAYRVVQEALTNTLKHAGPARAQVIVSYGDTDITISVLDTGQGREDSIDAPGSGFGLEVMRERAALYGGTVEAGRDSSGGYTVRVMLPVPQGVGG
jgi:signal transduction histidine kinase